MEHLLSKEVLPLGQQFPLAKKYSLLILGNPALSPWNTKLFDNPATEMENLFSKEGVTLDPSSNFSMEYQAHPNTLTRNHYFEMSLHLCREKIALPHSKRMLLLKTSFSRFPKTSMAPQIYIYYDHRIYLTQMWIMHMYIYMAWDCRKLWNVRRGFLDVIKACRSHFCGPIKGSPSSSHSFNFEVLVLPCYLSGGSHTDTKIYKQYTIQSTPDVIVHIDIHIHVRPHKL